MTKTGSGCSGLLLARRYLCHVILARATLCPRGPCKMRMHRSAQQALKGTLEKAGAIADRERPIPELNKEYENLSLVMCGEVSGAEGKNDCLDQDEG